GRCVRPPPPRPPPAPTCPPAPDGSAGWAEPSSVARSRTSSRSPSRVTDGQGRCGADRVPGPDARDDGLARGLDSSQDLSGAREQGVSRGQQPHAPGGALEEACPELLLQGRQLPADR